MLQRNKTARKLVSRRGQTVLAIGVVAGLAMASTSAQAGFFEQLFSGFQAQAPAPQPAYDYNPEPRSAAPSRVHHFRRRVASVSSKPVLQRTTSLMDDKTLRPGDAVMMKDGLHVYAGPESATHERDQFVRLDEAHRLSDKERVRLASMDTTRNDPLMHDNETNTIASGRSAAVASPVVAGYRITDVKGASVRYVGP